MERLAKAEGIAEGKAEGIVDVLLKQLTKLCGKLPEPDKIVERVEEAYRETDKLMQAVGLRGGNPHEKLSLSSKFV